MVVLKVFFFLVVKERKMETTVVKVGYERVDTDSFSDVLPRRFQMRDTRTADEKTIQAD